MDIRKQIKSLEFFVDHFGAFSPEGQIACGAQDTMEKLLAENKSLKISVEYYREQLNTWRDLGISRITQ